MMPEDIAEIEQYIRENDMLIIADKMSENKLSVLDSFAVLYPLTPYIIHKKHFSDIIILKNEIGRYRIDTMDSKAIEFDEPKIRADNTMKAGRLYFDKQRFDENGKIVLKDADFLEFGEKLIKWTKSHFKNARISPTWATERVAEWVKSTNGKLIE